MSQRNCVYIAKVSILLNSKLNRWHYNVGTAVKVGAKCCRGNKLHQFYMRYMSKVSKW